MSGDALEFEGVVRECFAGDLYSIDIAALPKPVLAKRSGRLNKHNIRIIAGDRVRIEVSPYDTARGRITRRL